MSKRNSLVAEFLVETMTNAGWFDEAGELLYDIASDNVEAATKQVAEIKECGAFIIEYGSKTSVKDTQELLGKIDEELQDVLDEIS